MIARVPIGEGPLGPRATLLNLKYNAPVATEVKAKQNKVHSIRRERVKPRKGRSVKFMLPAINLVHNIISVPPPEILEYSIPQTRYPIPSPVPQKRGPLPNIEIITFNIPDKDAICNG